MTATNEYGQQCPTEADALRALAEVLGTRAAEGIWDLCARELGLSRPVDTAADLRRMADHMMTVGDLLRVAGRSTKIRVITYDALSRTVTT